MERRELARDISSFDVHSKPYGKTYGQWTVEWWKWFLCTPRSINPVLDLTGQYAGVNQPSRNVWFLAGKLGDGNMNVPLRSCSVPLGRSVLIPVINCEANCLEYPELKEPDKLVNHVRDDENTIVKKVCYVNDVEFESNRIRSDPMTFEIVIPEDNVVGMVGGGKTLATGDGYWVFLKPLPVGEHFVSFAGSCESGRLFSGGIYKVLVQ